MSYDDINQSSEAYERKTEIEKDKVQVQMDIKEYNSNINFKNLKKFKTRAIIKDIMIIVLATVSGGFAGAYISNLKANNNAQNKTKAFSSTISRNSIDNDSYSRNTVSNVVKIVRPAIVGISNKGEYAFNSSSESNVTGFIYDSEGYIVTEYSAIKGASEITVKLPGSRLFPATVIGHDSKTGIGVIKINIANLSTVKIGDSSEVNTGDESVIVGNPGGEEFTETVTSGIISGVNRRIKIKDQESGKVSDNVVFQTDAVINYSDRGAPLCNDVGEVTGIICTGFESSTQKIKYVFPINDAVKIIDSIIKQGHVSRASIGVSGRTASSQHAKSIGFYIQYVELNSGAYNAEIKPTDILLEIDNKSVSKFEDIENILSKCKVGDTVICKISRQNKIVTKSVVLGEEK